MSDVLDLSSLGLAPDAPADTPVSDAPAADTPAPPAAEPQTPTPVNLTDDALLEFKVNGEVVRKPWSEIRQTQAMLPSAFTQKTQAIAEERRQLQEAYQQLQAYQQQVQERQAAVDAALQDPNRLGALYLAALSRAQGQQAPPGAPGMPGAPTSSPQTGLDPQMVQQLIDQRLQQQQQEWHAQQRTTSINQELDTFGKGLLQNTRLGRLRGADNLLWGEVLKMVQPGRDTLDTVREYARIVAQDLNRQLEEAAQGEVAQRTAVAAKAAASTPEASKGSAAPLPVKRDYKSLDDPALRDDMVEYMRQRLAAE